MEGRIVESRKNDTPLKSLENYLLLKKKYNQSRLLVEDHNSTITSIKSVFQQIHDLNQIFRSKLKKAHELTLTTTYAKFYFDLAILIYKYYQDAVRKKQYEKFNRKMLIAVQYCLQKSKIYINQSMVFYKEFNRFYNDIKKFISSKNESSIAIFDSVTAIIVHELRLTKLRQDSNKKNLIKILETLGDIYQECEEFQLALQHHRAAYQLFIQIYEQLYVKAEKNITSELKQQKISIQNLFSLSISESEINLFVNDIVDDTDESSADNLYLEFNKHFKTLLQDAYGHYHENELFGDAHNTITGKDNIKLFDEFNELSQVKFYKDIEDIFTKKFPSFRKNKSLIKIKETLSSNIKKPPLLQFINNMYEQITYFCYYTLDSRIRNIKLFETFEKILYSQLNTIEFIKALSDPQHQYLRNLKAIFSHLPQNAKKINYTKQKNLFSRILAKAKIIGLFDQNERLHSELEYAINGSAANHRAYLHEHIDNIRKLIDKYFNLYRIKSYYSEQKHEIIEVTMMSGCVSHALEKISIPKPWTGKEIRFIAEKTIYLDKHLTKEFFSGVNVIFISPELIIYTAEKIFQITTDAPAIENENIPGKALNGKNGTAENKDGAAGTHGINGKYGLSAGNICFISENIPETVNIQCSAKGSDGFNGQHGGGGGFGYEGADGNNAQADTSKKAKSSLKSEWYSWLAVDHGRPGRPGGIGGAAGYGGAPGVGGSGGKIEYIDLKFDEQTYSTKDSDGNNGQAGIPGQAGEGGYYGVNGKDHYHYHDWDWWPFKSSTIRNATGLLEHPKVDRDKGKYRLPELLVGKYDKPTSVFDNDSDYFARKQKQSQNGEKANIKTNNQCTNSNIAINKHSCLNIVANHFKNISSHWNVDSLNTFINKFAEVINTDAEQYTSDVLSRSILLEKNSQFWMKKIGQKAAAVKKETATHFRAQYTKQKVKQVLKPYHKTKKNDALNPVHFQEDKSLFDKCQINIIQPILPLKNWSTLVYFFSSKDRTDIEKMTYLEKMMISQNKVPFYNKTKFLIAFINQNILIKLGKSNAKDISKLIVYLKVCLKKTNSTNKEDIELLIKKLLLAKNSIFSFREMTHNYLKSELIYIQHHFSCILYQISGIENQDIINSLAKELQNQTAICKKLYLDCIKDYDIFSDLDMRIKHFNEFLTEESLSAVISAYYKLLNRRQENSSPQYFLYLKFLSKMEKNHGEIKNFFSAIIHNLSIFFTKNQSLLDSIKLINKPTGSLNTVDYNKKNTFDKKRDNYENLLVNYNHYKNTVKVHFHCKLDVLFENLLKTISEFLKTSNSVDDEKNVLLISKFAPSDCASNICYLSFLSMPNLQTASICLMKYLHELDNNSVQQSKIKLDVVLESAYASLQQTIPIQISSILNNLLDKILKHSVLLNNETIIKLIGLLILINLQHENITHDVNCDENIILFFENSYENLMSIFDKESILMNIRSTIQRIEYGKHLLNRINKAKEDLDHLKILIKNKNILWLPPGEVKHWIKQLKSVRDKFNKYLKNKNTNRILNIKRNKNVFIELQSLPKTISNIEKELQDKIRINCYVEDLKYTCHMCKQLSFEKYLLLIKTMHLTGKEIALNNSQSIQCNSHAIVIKLKNLLWQLSIQKTLENETTENQMPIEKYLSISKYIRDSIKLEFEIVSDPMQKTKLYFTDYDPGKNYFTKLSNNSVVIQRINPENYIAHIYLNDCNEIALKNIPKKMVKNLIDNKHIISAYNGCVEIITSAINLNKFLVYLGITSFNNLNHSIKLNGIQLLNSKNFDLNIIIINTVDGRILQRKSYDFHRQKDTQSTEADALSTLDQAPTKTLIIINGDCHTWSKSFIKQLNIRLLKKFNHNDTYHFDLQLIVAQKINSKLITINHYNSSNTISKNFYLKENIIVNIDQKHSNNTFNFIKPYFEIISECQSILKNIMGNVIAILKEKLSREKIYNEDEILEHSNDFLLDLIDLSFKQLILQLNEFNMDTDIKSSYLSIVNFVFHYLSQDIKKKKIDNEKINKYIKLATIFWKFKNNHISIIPLLNHSVFLAKALKTKSFDTICNFILFTETISRNYSPPKSQTRSSNKIHSTIWKTILSIIVSHDELLTNNDFDKVVVALPWLENIYLYNLTEENKKTPPTFELMLDNTKLECIEKGIEIIFSLMNQQKKDNEFSEAITLFLKWGAHHDYFSKKIKQSIHNRAVEDSCSKLIVKTKQLNYIYSNNILNAAYQMEKKSVHDVASWFDETGQSKNKLQSNRKKINLTIQTAIIENLLKHQYSILENIFSSTNYSTSQRDHYNALIQLTTDFIQLNILAFKDGDFHFILKLNKILKLLQLKLASPDVVIDFNTLKQLFLLLLQLNELKPAKYIIDQLSPKDWLKNLLICSFIECYQEIFELQDDYEIQNLKQSLAKINFAFLKLFHNKFIKDYYNIAADSNNEVLLLLTKNNIDTIIVWLQNTDETNSTLHLLFAEPLASWEQCLYDINYTKTFSNWSDIPLADKKYIQYSLNKIRLSMQSDDQERFIIFFHNIKHAIAKHKNIDSLYLLFQQINSEVLSLEDVEYIVNNVQYNDWKSEITDFINKQHSQPRTNKEIMSFLLSHASQEDIQNGATITIENAYKAIWTIRKKALPLINKIKSNPEEEEHKIKAYFDQLDTHQTVIAKEKWLCENLEDFICHLVCAYWISSNKNIEKRIFARNTQLYSIILFLTSNDNSALCQVSTGEGKTLIVALLAAAKIHLGYNVDIITSNRDLAQEAVRKCKKFYKFFKFQARTNCTDDDEVNKQAYTANIVYGDVGSFQRDVLEKNSGDENVFSDRYKKPTCLVVDEVDSMLLDKGRNMLYVAHESPQLKQLEFLFINIFSAVLSLDLENFEELDIEGELTSIADKLLKLIKNKQIWVPESLHDFCQKKMIYWLNSALQAHLMKINDDFILDKSKLQSEENPERNIIVIDKSTGIEEYSTNWSNGLTQFLQLKFRRRFTNEQLKVDFISNKLFFKRYGKNLFGVTGTLGCHATRQLLRTIYRVVIYEIPTYKRKRFTAQPSYAEVSHRAWLERCIQQIDQYRTQQPVLVICNNIDDAEKIYDQLCTCQNQIASTDKQNQFKIIRYIRDGDEIESRFENKPAKPQQVIIATNKGGRGTNIIVDIKDKAPNGLHLILTFLPQNKRIEEQALGRTARSGQPGSGNLIIQIDDMQYENLLSNSKNQPELIHAIILEKEKISRDEYERIRINEMISIGLPQLDLEEELYDNFNKLKIILKNKMQYLLLNNKRIETKVEQALLDIVADKWAFWLDCIQAKLSEYKITLEKEIILDDFKENLTDPMLIAFSNKTALLTLFKSAHDYIILGNAYMENKNYDLALGGFTHAIELTDTTGYSGLAAAFCFCKKNSTANRYNKKRIRKYLKQAYQQFDKMRQNLMVNLEVVNNLPSSEKIGQQTSGIENYYGDQIKEKLQIVGLHLHKLEQLIGKSIEANEFVEKTERGEIEKKDAELIYQKLVENNIIYDKEICSYWKKPANRTGLRNALYSGLPNTQAEKLMHMIIASKKISIDNLQVICFGVDELWHILLANQIIEHSSRAIVIDKMSLSSNFHQINLECRHLWQTFVDTYLTSNINNFVNWTMGIFGKEDEEKNVDFIITQDNHTTAYTALLSEEYRPLKEYLINQAYARITWQAKIKIQGQIHGKHIKQYHTNNNLEYINETLTFCRKEKQGYLYQYMLPYDTKLVEAKKIYAFLTTINLFKSGGLKKFKYETDTDKLNKTVKKVLKNTEIHYTIKTEIANTDNRIQSLSTAWKNKPKNKNEFLLIFQGNNRQHHICYYNNQGEYISVRIIDKQTLFKKLNRRVKSFNSYSAFKENTQNLLPCILDDLQFPTSYECYHESIQKKVSNLYGEIRLFSDQMKVQLVNFFDLEQRPDDIPMALNYFVSLHLDNFLCIEHKIGWWNWDAFACAMIGLSQIIAGTLLIAFSSGIAIQIGEALIAEGINDLVYATMAGLEGSFSWKDWAIQKAISIPITIATGGLNHFLSSAKHAKVLQKPASKIFAKTMKYVATEFAIQVSTNLLSNKAMEIIQNAVLDSFIDWIVNGVHKNVSYHLDQKIDMIRRQQESTELFQKAITELSGKLKKNLDTSDKLKEVAQGLFVQGVALLRQTYPKMIKKIKKKSTTTSGLVNNAMKVGFIAYDIHQIVSTGIEIYDLVQEMQTVIDDTVHIDTSTNQQNTFNMDTHSKNLEDAISKQIHDVVSNYIQTEFKEKISTLLQQVMYEMVSRTSHFMLNNISKGIEQRLKRKKVKKKRIKLKKKTRQTKSPHNEIVTSRSEKFQNKPKKVKPKIKKLKFKHIEKNITMIRRRFNQTDHLFPPDGMGTLAEILHIISKMLHEIKLALDDVIEFKKKLSVKMLYTNVGKQLQSSTLPESGKIIKQCLSMLITTLRLCMSKLKCGHYENKQHVVNIKHFINLSPEMTQSEVDKVYQRYILGKGEKDYRETMSYFKRQYQRAMLFQEVKKPLTALKSLLLFYGDLVMSTTNMEKFSMSDKSFTQILYKKFENLSLSEENVKALWTDAKDLIENKGLSEHGYMLKQGKMSEQGFIISSLVSGIFESDRLSQENHGKALVLLANLSEQVNKNQAELGQAVVRINDERTKMLSKFLGDNNEQLTKYREFSQKILSKITDALLEDKITESKYKLLDASLARESQSIKEVAIAQQESAGKAMQANSIDPEMISNFTKANETIMLALQQTIRDLGQQQATTTQLLTQIASKTIDGIFDKLLNRPSTQTTTTQASTQSIQTNQQPKALPSTAQVPGLLFRPNDSANTNRVAETVVQNTETSIPGPGSRAGGDGQG